MTPLEPGQCSKVTSWPSSFPHPKEKADWCGGAVGAGAMRPRDAHALLLLLLVRAAVPEGLQPRESEGCGAGVGAGEGKGNWFFQTLGVCYSAPAAVPSPCFLGPDPGTGHLSRSSGEVLLPHDLSQPLGPESPPLSDVWNHPSLHLLPSLKIKGVVSHLDRAKLGGPWTCILALLTLPFLLSHSRPGSSHQGRHWPGCPNRCFHTRVLGRISRHLAE